MCIKFGDDRLMGFWLVGCQISPIPIDFACRPYNSEHYGTACTVISSGQPQLFVSRSLAGADYLKPPDRKRGVTKLKRK